VAVARSAERGREGRIGALVGGDLVAGPRGGGAVLQAGLCYVVSSHVETSIVALLGGNVGVHFGAAMLPGSGRLRPRFAAGASLLSVEGPKPGLRAAAGLQLEPNVHFALLAELGIWYLPNVPARFDKTLFAASLALQARL
jgi:hypothetical protein